MPTRTTAASRRFYRAFYEWTLLISPAGATAAGRGHGFHTSSRAQQGFTIRKHWHRRDPPGKEPGQGGKEPQREQNPRNELEYVPGAWKTGPVLTATEKPFSTLRPYDVVVRYRSDYGLMLELAVPENVLKKVQKKLGMQLEQLSDGKGARVEIQQLSAHAAMFGMEDARIRSVLVSGTFVEAYRIVRQIKSYRNGPLDAQVYSHLARPSGTLFARESVWRESIGTLSRMELSVPESVFMQFVAASSVEALREKFNVDVEVGEPELRPVEKESAKTGMARSFLVSGTIEDIQRAKGHILAGPRDHGHTTSLDQDGSPASSRGLSSSGGFSSSGSGKRASSERTDSRIPLAQQSLAGVSAEGLQFCRARIVGPTSHLLRDAIMRGTTSPKEFFGLPTRSHMLRTQNGFDITVSAKPPAVEQFQRKLRNRIDGLCVANNFAPHDIEFHTEILDDTALHASDHVVCRPYPVGPNAARLWDMLKNDMAQGWRLYGHEPCHVDKNTGALTLTGTAIGTNSAIDAIRFRLEQLCTALAYPQHALSVPRRSADPTKTARLATDVRDAFRALTHPVVLITASDRIVDQGSGRAHRHSSGATVSSFNAVTLEPQPIVAFNLKLPSRTWNKINNSQQFVAHILSASSRGSAIADCFTRAHNTPLAGFEVMEAMGLTSNPAHRSGPICLTPERSAILAWMHVDLLPHKCIEVGDHLIVVGVVRKIKTLEGASDDLALSYSMRAYRGTDGGQLEPDFSPIVRGPDVTNESSGGRIISSPASDPSEPAAQVAQHDMELDPLRLGEELDVGVEPPSQPSSHEEAQSFPPLSDEDLDDPVYKALMSAREKLRQEEEVDLFEAFNAQGEEAPLQQLSEDKVEEHAERAAKAQQEEEADLYDPFNAQSEEAPLQQLSQDKVEEHAERAAKAQQEEEEYDFGFDEPEQASAFPKHDDFHAETSQEPSRTPQASTSSSSALFKPMPSSNRSFSTFARSLGILRRSPLPPYRLASTLAESRMPRDNSDVLDPATAQSTVSDYLSLSDNTYDEQGHFKLYVKQVGVRGSLVAKEDIARLKDLLERGYKVSKTGEDIALRPDEIAGIQHKILLCERKICINLAVNAMRTLRDMLDKARYGELFWRRVPYMESLIEQGMATLMQEARELRSLLDGGKIEREKYEALSAQMKGRYDAMEIEVGRLRQVTEEEGDGGVKGFDDDD